MKIRKLTPEQIDDRCLAFRRQKIMPAYIRVVLGISLQRVYDGIERARQREAQRGAAVVTPDPRSEPLFPIDSFTPRSRCPHRGPIARGSIFVCMVCHQSGLDHLASLRRPAALPREPKAAARKAKSA